MDGYPFPQDLPVAQAARWGRRVLDEKADPSTAPPSDDEFLRDQVVNQDPLTPWHAAQEPQGLDRLEGIFQPARPEDEEEWVPWYIETLRAEILEVGGAGV